MKIKSAKERFIKSGTIREDFIRKDILSSWERSRIYKIPQNKYESISKDINLISRDLNQSMTKKIFGQVMIADLSGDVLFRMGDEIELITFENLEEKEIGTTAFSLSKISKQFECVEKNEHYINTLEKYNSYAKHNINNKMWTVLFSELSWSNSEIHELEGELFDAYKKYKKEKTLQERVSCMKIVNSGSIQKEVVLAGISREILSVKRQLENLSYTVVNLVLITCCKLTLQAMVQMIVESRYDNIREKKVDCLCTSIDMDGSYDLKTLSESLIVFVENIHLFSYKLQMDLLRYLQQKPKEQCFLWGFYSSQDLEIIQETTVPLLFEYLKGTQIKLKDIDTRSADIKLISQKYVEMNYPDYFVDPRFYLSLGQIKQAKSLITLLNYLKFKCDMNAQTKLLSVDRFGYKELSHKKTLVNVDSELEELVYTCKLEDLEREQIEKILLSNDYQLAKTAKILGIGRTTLYRKMKLYKIINLKSK